jgi:hypothetical protein
VGDCNAYVTPRNDLPAIGFRKRDALTAGCCGIQHGKSCDSNGRPVL